MDTNPLSNDSRVRRWIALSLAVLDLRDILRDDVRHFLEFLSHRRD